MFGAADRGLNLQTLPIKSLWQKNKVQHSPASFTLKFGDQAYYAKYDKYLCRDPCGPHDLHLIVAATDKTLAPNRDPRFTIAKVPNSNGAQITTSDVKPTEAGTYWCGIEYPSSDMYRQLTVIVIVNGPPDPHDALLNTLSDVNTVTWNWRQPLRTIWEHYQTYARCHSNLSCSKWLMVVLAEIFGPRMASMVYNNDNPICSDFLFALHINSMCIEMPV